MSIQLEQPDPDQAQDLADLRTIYQQDPPALAQLPAHLVAGTATVEAALRHPDLEMHAIRFNSRLIAAACAWRPQPDTLHIAALAVRESSRDRGLQERIVRGLLKRQTAETCCVEVAQPTTPEAPFESSLEGFHLVGGAENGVLRFRRSA